MLNSLSSNVVLAKARTMYGKRLTTADYNELLKSRTVGEVAGYLKNHTVYSKALAGIVESDVHRGELESVLKQKLMEEYTALCKNEAETDKYFSRYFIQCDEVRCILHTVLRLNGGVSDSPADTIPSYLYHYSSLDLKAFSQVRDFDGLMKLISGSPYQKIMEPFSPEQGERIDYTGVENALYFFVYSDILATIRRHFRGETRKELRSIFESYVDLNNYVRVSRLKLIYGADEDTVRKSLLPAGSFSKEETESLVKAKSEEEINAVLSQTRLGRQSLKIRHSYLDEIPSRINFMLCRHYIDYSIHPPVTLISYILLCQNEINNIITIVEGVRYKLPPQEIKKLLTFENFRFSEVSSVAKQRSGFSGSH